MEESAPSPRHPIDTVAEHYSADAAAYETSWAPVLRPHGRRLLERLPLGVARRVLDAGAGVGTLLADLQRMAPSATVVAADVSPGMIARADRSLPRLVMDMTRLGFPGETFDVVVIAFALFHLEEPERALREAHRVLRHGGALGTATWDGEPRFAAQTIWMEELDAHGAAVEGPGFANHEPVSSPGKMRDQLEAAGFGSIESWMAPFDHPYDPEEFITIRTTRGYARRRLESLDTGRRHAFLRRVRERLSSLPASDFVDRCQMVYATGLRPASC